MSWTKFSMSEPMASIRHPLGSEAERMLKSFPKASRLAARTSDIALGSDYDAQKARSIVL
jgi:hypothetical protein